MKGKGCGAERTSHFERALRKLDRTVRERLDGALKLLAEDRLVGHHLKAELKYLRSLRVGDYRIIYEPGDCTLLARDVGHRRSVYGSR